MGRMIFEHQLYKVDARWFNSQTINSGGSWPDVTNNIQHDYPFELAIHLDDLDKRYNNRVQIRRFIDQHLAGDVFVQEIDKSYQQGRQRITHEYMVFHFEHETDCVAFQLMFGELTSAITPFKKEHEPLPTV